MDARTLERVASLLTLLSNTEYWIRKYRARGDARASQGAGRSSSEYHGMAVESLRKAEAIVQELTDLLGPEARPLLARGEPTWFPSDVDDPASFEDACFFARHPAWAVHVDRLRDAHDRWRDDPRFQSQAPDFQPIHEGWTD